MPQDNIIDNLPLEDKVKHILSILKKASPDEVAMEIIEMQGIAAEEEVADLTLETKELLEKLCEAGAVVKVKEPRQKVRYRLAR